MALFAAVKPVKFVPPLATGKTPVTPEVRGNPVAFVRVPDKGVPSAPPETTRVADNGIVVPFTEVTLGREVVAVVTKVEDEGIVVPLIDEAVAAPSEGVVKEGLTNGA
jgi:hypothetical protein